MCRFNKTPRSTDAAHLLLFSVVILTLPKNNKIASAVFENKKNLCHNSYYMSRVENVVAREENDHYKQFLLLSPRFQRSFVYCRCVNMRQYEGKGYKLIQSNNILSGCERFLRSSTTLTSVAYCMLMS